jgi:hypothetical protein
LKYGVPQSWIDYFEGLEKKDDIADAFLQGAVSFFFSFELRTLLKIFISPSISILHEV